MKQFTYAGIIIDQILPSLDKIFHYEIPLQLQQNAKLGMRVLVPFGRSRGVEGYIVSLEQEVDIPKDKIKNISRFLDPYPLLTEGLFPLVWWMKKEYHCLTIEAIRCFIPAGIRVNIKEKTQRVVNLYQIEELEETIKNMEKGAPKMAAILRVLEQEDGIPLKALLEMTGASYSSIRSLEAKRYVSIQEEETYRNPWKIENVSTHPPTFNFEQQFAVEEIYKVQQTGGGTVLMHGVTGSGKTEVYMNIVEKTLHAGKQVIVLVPEISLTPQTVGRFKGRFGNNIAILHSGLSLGERYDEWRRIRNDEVDIVVGARSAVFAPLSRLGAIILDEAHDDSYKSEVRPRYHTRDVAAKRCRMEGAVLLLGSATPSLQDYYDTITGNIQKVVLANRIDMQIMPVVEIVDMRKELEMGNRSIFSQVLFNNLSQTLQRREQVILLLNRRGYAQFVSCRSCGFVVKCENCDISLTYHVQDKTLKCHYCGQFERYPEKCPQCSSKYIKHFGLGTQRVEEELKTLFPHARLLRMDMDTTSRKGSHHKMLDAFGQGQYDILLGTQMVAKGLDFPNVTLVGVIAADAALNLPDYRSSEKTFQLITQVAGRAGRGEKSGKVVVQTYQPTHYAIEYASRHDYEGFFHKEIDIRRNFDYPPFSQIIRILVTGEVENELVQCSKNMIEWIQGHISKNTLLAEGLIDAGAYPAPLERINNKYRWHILIRIRNDEKYQQGYHQFADVFMKTFNHQTAYIALDFWPLSLL